jgi:hypothetical protein
VVKQNMRFMADKKKFKDTKVGQFVLSKLPNFVSSVLPNDGVLGIVKNLIDTDPAIGPEEKAQMHRELTALYELEVADRDSARKREVEIAKTGRFDFMFNFNRGYWTGIVCVYHLRDRLFDNPGK